MSEIKVDYKERDRIWDDTHDQMYDKFRQGQYIRHDANDNTASQYLLSLIRANENLYELAERLFHARVETGHNYTIRCMCSGEVVNIQPVFSDAEYSALADCFLQASLHCASQQRGGQVETQLPTRLKANTKPDIFDHWRHVNPTRLDALYPVIDYQERVDNYDNTIEAIYQYFEIHNYASTDGQKRGLLGRLSLDNSTLWQLKTRLLEAQQPEANNGGIARLKIAEEVKIQPILSDAEFYALANCYRIACENLSKKPQYRPQVHTQLPTSSPASMSLVHDNFDHWRYVISSLECLKPSKTNERP